ncbi:MAG: hypothetical protein H8D97_00890 [Proteobacteria bacterium]|nr:hypothetical protein [Pseudomonadota bacterium]
MQQQQQEEKTSDEIIAAVTKWQSLIGVPHLKCGENNSHQPLICLKNCNNDAYLICLDCNYTQNHIPEVVINCKDMKVSHIDKNNIEHLRNI